MNPTSLQSDVVITDGKIAGTSKYYDGSGWDAGTWSADEKAGNFLALKFDADDGATIKVGLIPSASGSGLITLDSDKNIVIRISDKNEQKLHVQVEKDSVIEEQVYSLAALTVQSE